MNMWISARTFTHDDLRRAFDAYAEAHGHELATSALERSTGAREVSAVPQERIINGMAELVGQYSFVCKASGHSSALNTLSAIRGRLDIIRVEAFHRMSKGTSTN